MDFFGFNGSSLAQIVTPLKVPAVAAVPIEEAIEAETEAVLTTMTRTSAEEWCNPSYVYYSHNLE